jgi:hypothetical protein
MTAAIDIRANVYCNLGPLIQGQIADDYVQDSGLIRTRGSVTLRGIYTPDVGDQVSFAFYKDGTLSRIPRTLRVLSSFADPFTKITTVQIGCFITFIADMKDPPIERQLNGVPLTDAAILYGGLPLSGAVFARLNAVADAAGGGLVPSEDRKGVGGTITAAFIVSDLASKAGLTVGSIPLTNQFSKTYFEYNQPYVDIISDLLKSECRLGYLDESEELVIRDLNETGQTGPIIDADDIIELQGIGSGELPGASVIVRYNSIEPGKNPQVSDPDDPDAVPNQSRQAVREEADEQTSRANWERSVSSQGPIIVTVSTGSGTKRRSKVYSGIEKTESNTQYAYHSGSGKEVKTKEETIKTSFTAKAASGLAQEYLEKKQTFVNEVCQTTEVVNHRYNPDGTAAGTERLLYEPIGMVVGRLNIPLSGKDYILPFFQGEVLTERETVELSHSGGRTRRVTSQYALPVFAIEGQIGAFRSGKGAATQEDIENTILDWINTGLVFVDKREDIQESGEIQPYGESRPSQTDRVTNALGNGASGGTTKAERQSVGFSAGSSPTYERTASFEVVYGAVDSARRIELTMPYAPDSVFTLVSANTQFPAGLKPYMWTNTDAQQKAKKYGEVQNRMRIGHRKGVSLQVPIGKMPERPFDPFYLSAEGLTGQYRVNGLTWAFDSNGIVCSVDALFWGGAGQD